MEKEQDGKNWYFEGDELVIKNRVLQAFTPTDWVQAGTAAVGDRVATYCAIDGSDKYTMVLLLTHGATNALEIVVQV